MKLNIGIKQIGIKQIHHRVLYKGPGGGGGGGGGTLNIFNNNNSLKVDFEIAVTNKLGPLTDLLRGLCAHHAQFGSILA